MAATKSATQKYLFTVEVNQGTEFLCTSATKKEGRRVAALVLEKRFPSVLKNKIYCTDMSTELPSVFISEAGDTIVGTEIVMVNDVCLNVNCPFNKKSCLRSFSDYENLDENVFVPVTVTVRSRNGERTLAYCEANIDAQPIVFERKVTVTEEPKSDAEQEVEVEAVIQALDVFNELIKPESGEVIADLEKVKQETEIEVAIKESSEVPVSEESTVVVPTRDVFDHKSDTTDSDVKSSVPATPDNYRSSANDYSSYSDTSTDSSSDSYSYSSSDSSSWDSSSSDD